MRILDLTAGKRAIWYDKENPLVTFLDIRPEMNPTIVCDTRNIPDEAGKDFDLIVYDPPHLCCGPNSTMGKKYGNFKTDEILDSISKTSKEAHRVSRKGALMAFKFNDHDIKFERALDLMKDEWTPLFGNVTKFATRSTTRWILLLRKD